MKAWKTNDATGKSICIFRLLTQPDARKEIRDREIKKKMRWKILHLCLAASTFFATALHGEVITRNDGSLRNITEALDLVEDVSSSWSAKEIVQKKLAWNNVGQDALSLGYSDSTHWLRFTFENQSPETDWYLELHWITLDSAELYSSSGDLLQQTGDILPYSRWSISSSYPTFHIHLPSGKKETFYIKLKSQSILSFPVNLMGSRVYFDRFANFTAVTFLVLGVGLLFILYNIFLALRFRDFTYTWFGLKVLFLAMTLFIGYGNAYAYLWPESPWWQNRSQTVFFCLALGASAEFSRWILGLKKNSRALNYILMGMSVSCGFLALLFLTNLPQVWRTRVASSFYFLGLGVFLLASLFSMKTLYRTSLYLLLGWLCFLGAASMNILYHLGFFRYGIITIYGTIMSIPLEYFFFSMSLSARIREMEERVLKIEEEKSELLRRLTSLTTKPPAYSRSYLQGLDAGPILFRLRELMEKDKLFRNDELAAQELADRLSISIHQLSEILNRQLGTNFFRLVNEYRIQEAAESLKKDPEKTVLRIALDSGFSSKSTFNREFKRIMGKSPVEFRQNS